MDDKLTVKIANFTSLENTVSHICMLIIGANVCQPVIHNLHYPLSHTYVCTYIASHEPLCGGLTELPYTYIQIFEVCKLIFVILFFVNHLLLHLVFQ